MAYVKTSVDNLNQQKKEYEKAIKSLNNALEQIKKVNSSLGTDDMLEGVRTALTKLSASLETRAGILLNMTKALEQSGEKYTAAQKKAVEKSNQFRAHNRDFYGNPIVITAETVVISASAAGGSIPVTSPNTENVSVQTDSEIPTVTYTESDFGTDVPQESAYAENTAAVPEATEPSASQLIEEPVPTVSAGSDPAVSAGSGHAEVGAVTGAVDTDASDPRANVFATGAAAAAGAVVGGIAGAAMGTLVKPGQKKKRPTQDEKEQELTTIEAQLEAARERLRQLNEE